MFYDRVYTLISFSFLLAVLIYAEFKQKTNLGTKIFGSDSIRTALLLAKDGAEGFDKMAASIGKVNAAAQGAILSKGFAGALEGLKSATEGLGIAIVSTSKGVLSDRKCRTERIGGELLCTVE